jgi:hypothetical protein
VLTKTQNDVNKLNQADYTSESWTALQNALKAAKDVAVKPNATRDEVKAAQDALAQVYAKLTKKTVIDQPPQDKDPGTGALANKIDLSSASAKLTIADVVWTGKQIKTGFKVKSNGKVLKLGTDFKIKAVGKNKNIGKGTVTITGAGDYTGEKTLTVKIVPKKLPAPTLKPGKKLVKFTWKKGAAAAKLSGYEVRYKVKNGKTWKLKSVKVTKTSLTVKKLVKGKKYQAQVRAYKKVASVKYYGAWSKVKTSSKKVS